jgi:hypothetical protein
MERVNLHPGDVVAERFRVVSAHDDLGFGARWRVCTLQGSKYFTLSAFTNLREGLQPSRAVEIFSEVLALRHVHLSHIAQTFQHDSVVFAATEVSEGELLRPWLQSASPTAPHSITRLREVIDQIAMGLAAIHRFRRDQRIAHGALDCRCVRIERRGEALIVARVEAFGFALVAEPQLLYVPPEGSLVTPTADVFALGCIAAELLTGVAPHRVAPHDLREHFSQHRPELDPTLLRTVLECTTPDPGARPIDAEHARALFRRARWTITDRPRKTTRPEPPIPVSPPDHVRAVTTPRIQMVVTRAATTPLVVPVAREQPVESKDVDESTLVNAATYPVSEVLPLSTDFDTMIVPKRRPPQNVVKKSDFVLPAAEPTQSSLHVPIAVDAVESDTLVSIDTDNFTAEDTAETRLPEVSAAIDSESNVEENTFVMAPLQGDNFSAQSPQEPSFDPTTEAIDHTFRSMPPVAASPSQTLPEKVAPFVPVIHTVIQPPTTSTVAIVIVIAVVATMMTCVLGIVWWKW